MAMRKHKEHIFFSLELFCSIVVCMTFSSHLFAKTIGYTGYIATDNVQYNWIDISQTGTEILSDEGCHDSEYVWLGDNINFSFYDEQVSYMFIRTSGIISFNDVEYLDCEPEQIPYQVLYRNHELIAPYWSVLGTYGFWEWSPDNAVYYQILGQQPSRQMIVQWNNVTKEEDSENSGSITFQVILYEDSNEIKFQYKDVDFENDANYSNGGFASIGVQGHVWSSTEGLQWSYNESVLRDEYAILFKPVPIPPPVSLTIDYTADANVQAEAEVFGEPYVEDFDSDYNSTNNEAVYTEAYAEAWGEMQGPGGLELTCQTAQMNVYDGYSGGGSGRIEFNSSMDFEAQKENTGMPISSSASGEGEAKITGEIEIGSSAQLPAGHTCLKVHAMTDIIPGSMWDNWNYQMKVWQNDSNEPLALLQSINSAEFAVAAGSTLYFEYSDNRNIHIDDFDMPEYSIQGEVHFIMNFTPVILPGDNDINGMLNLIDYAAVAQRWMDSVCGEPDWCNGADLDRNGKVEWEDLHGLLQNWLKEAE